MPTAWRFALCCSLVVATAAAASAVRRASQAGALAGWCSERDGDDAHDDTAVAPVDTRAWLPIELDGAGRDDVSHVIGTTCGVVLEFARCGIAVERGAPGQYAWLIGGGGLAPAKGAKRCKSNRRYRAQLVARNHRDSSARIFVVWSTNRKREYRSAFFDVCSPALDAIDERVHGPPPGSLLHVVAFEETYRSHMCGVVSFRPRAAKSMWHCPAIPRTETITIHSHRIREEHPEDDEEAKAARARPAPRVDIVAAHTVAGALAFLCTRPEWREGNTTHAALTTCTVHSVGGEKRPAMLIMREVDDLAVAPTVVPVPPTAYGRAAWGDSYVVVPAATGDNGGKPRLHLFDFRRGRLRDVTLALGQPQVLGVDVATGRLLLRARHGEQTVLIGHAAIDRTCCSDPASVAEAVVVSSVGPRAEERCATATDVLNGDDASAPVVTDVTHRIAHGPLLRYVAPGATPGSLVGAIRTTEAKCRYVEGTPTGVEDAKRAHLPCGLSLNQKGPFFHFHVRGYEVALFHTAGGTAYAAARAIGGLQVAPVWQRSLDRGPVTVAWASEAGRACFYFTALDEKGKSCNWYEMCVFGDLRRIGEHAPFFACRGVTAIDKHGDKTWFWTATRDRRQKGEASYVLHRCYDVVTQRGDLKLMCDAAVVLGPNTPLSIDILHGRAYVGYAAHGVHRIVRVDVASARGETLPDDMTADLLLDDAELLGVDRAAGALLARRGRGSNATIVRIAVSVSARRDGGPAASDEL